MGGEIMRDDDIISNPSNIQRIDFNPVSDFNLYQTFECGQCFRWRHDPVQNAYIGVVEGNLLKAYYTPNEGMKEGIDVVSEKPRSLPISVTWIESDWTKEQAIHYFDWNFSYHDIAKNYFSEDPMLSHAAHIASGLRILNQSPFEIIISFIISANNNIPKIKMTVEDLCRRCGEYIGTSRGVNYYAFPTPESILSQPEQVYATRAIGYRAKYVLATAKKIAEGALDLSAMYKLPFDEAKEALKILPGVGDKVADCVLLYAYHRQEAFPLDTWVKRMLQEYYGVTNHYRAFVLEHFMPYAGLAQQYLFYDIRRRHKRQK